MSYAHPEYLVETDWVAKHLNDPKVRIIESDEDPLLYAMGHIPGAVQVDWFSTLQHPLRRDFLTQEKFEETMSKLGVGNNTTVVFYGDKSNWFACYALWLFQYYGHKNVRIMNGGRAKWEKERRGKHLEFVKQFSFHVSTTFMDYLHGDVPKHEREAACGYEYARESRLLREAARERDRLLASRANRGMSGKKVALIVAQRHASEWYAGSPWAIALLGCRSFPARPPASAAPWPIRRWPVFVFAPSKQPAAAAIHRDRRADRAAS